MFYPQTSSEGQVAEEMSDGFECSICLDLLCEPVQLPCNHAFCRSCLILDSVRERSCPLCRSKFPEGFDARAAPVHDELENYIRCAYPQTYFERQAAQSARTLHLRIGNRFQILTTRPQNCYRWTVFIELERLASSAPELIGKDLCDLVEYMSFDSPPGARVFKCGSYSAEHENFSLPQYEVYNQPYELIATGWKTKATVNITIFWKKWLQQQPTTFQHTPEFVGEELTDKGWVYAVDLGQALSSEASIVKPSGRSSPESFDADLFQRRFVRSSSPHRAHATSGDARNEAVCVLPSAPATKKPRQMRRLSVAPKTRRLSVRAMRSIMPSRVSKFLS